MDFFYPKPWSNDWDEWYPGTPTKYFFPDVLRKCNEQGQYLSRGLDHSVSYTAVAEYACSTMGDALIDRFLEWESEVLTSRS